MTKGLDLKYVFGPVLSRRLGRSLGVDLVPFKTCTYDCVYCQLGATTLRTVERKEYVPLDELLIELQCTFERGVAADYISLAGSGEPTLYSRLGELIGHLKRMTSTPIAVITNGSLLWDPQVRRELFEADLVIPSLDAGNADLFARINQPACGISFAKMVDGLVAFRDEFRGQIWLEIFLIGGTTDDEVRELAACAARMQPDRIQLNSVARPAPGAAVQPIPADQLRRYASWFTPEAEVITHADAPASAPAASAGHCHAGPQDMLDIIKRHPCTLDELIAVLGLPRQEAEKNINLLLDRRDVEKCVQDGTDFYVAR